MKLMMMLYAGSRPDHVTEVLDAHQARAFTEIDRAHGRGRTGRVEGTRAWPGETTVLLAVVPDEQVAELEDALRRLAVGANPGERLHVAVLPVEHFF